MKARLQQLWRWFKDLFRDTPEDTNTEDDDIQNRAW